MSSAGDVRTISVRNYKGVPRNLRVDEVWFDLTIKLPAAWGRKGGDIVLEVPEGAVSIAGEWGGVGATADEAGTLK